MSPFDRERWRVLSPLLEHALELSSEERAAWLRQLDADSPTIVAELTSLLSGESAADRRGFLSNPVDVSLEGLELGAYTLERPIGHGGMGSVWLARRSDGRFEGQAAAKLLNLALFSPSGQARFRREGRTLARLSHPAIARLLDAGLSAGGQPYLLLEYVDGVPIDRYVEEHQLSLDQRLHLFSEVLAAVGHAHANLIVHRDLKPSNILVTTGGQVKLLDFGIAKLLDSSESGAPTAITRDGERAMTPEFAAPEQLSGGEVTTATDVYALGVLLYLLVSGNHPTAVSRPTARSAPDAPRAIDPPPLGRGDLDTVVAKTLKAEPHDRYQTVAELAEDIGHFRRHEPVSARRDSLAYRAHKFVRRNRSGVAAATVVACTLIGATVFSVRQMREAQRQRDGAIESDNRAAAQLQFQSLLTSQVGDRPITMRETLDRARAALEHQYATDPRTLATILTELSARYSDLGENAIRRSLLARADSIATLAHDTSQLAGIRCEEASALRVDGKPDDARRAFDRADAILHADPIADQRIVCLQGRAELEEELADTSGVATHARLALALLDSIGRPTDPRYVSILATLGGNLDLQHRYREALAMYERAEAMLDSGGRGEIIEKAIVAHDRALTLNTLGEVAAAERILHEVVQQVAQSDPSGHLPPQPAIHYAQEALVAGHPDSAAKYFGLLAAQGARQHEPYWEGRATFGQALAWLALGDRARATQTITRFRPMDGNPRLRSTDDHIIDVRVLDAHLAALNGDSATAHRRIVDMLREHAYFDGKASHRIWSALVFASATALAVHQPDSALRFARDARTVSEVDSLAIHRSAYVGEAQLMEARALLAGGDSAGARAAARGAMDALRSGAGPEDVRTRSAEQLLSSLERCCNR